MKQKLYFNLILLVEPPRRYVIHFRIKLIRGPGGGQGVNNISVDEAGCLPVQGGGSWR